MLSLTGPVPYIIFSISLTHFSNFDLLFVFEIEKIVLRDRSLEGTKSDLIYIYTYIFIYMHTHIYNVYVKSRMELVTTNELRNFGLMYICHVWNHNFVLLQRRVLLF